MSVAASVVERSLVRRKRPAVTGAWLLSGAMLVSGVLAYGFHVLAARTLGPGAYGRIAALWAAVFLVAVVLFRPLEQTLARAIADRQARGEEVRNVVRTVVSISAIVAAVGAVAIVLGWDTIKGRLFDGSNFLTAALLGGIVAYGFAYVCRGLFGGVRWFNGYGVGLVADAVARVAIAIPLVIVASQNLAAAAIVGAGIAGAVVPLWLGRRRLDGSFAGGTPADFRVQSALRFAAPATVIAASDQLLVNGAPLLVLLGGAGGTKTAGVVFAATMLVRAPVYVFQGLAASLLPNLTHLQAKEELEQFRRAIVRVVGFLLLAGAAIVVATATAGSGAMALYGSGFYASRGNLVLLAVGVAFYLSAATLSQALLSLDAAKPAAVAWTIAAITFVGGYAVFGGSDLTRVSVSFALATLTGAVALGLILLARIRRT